MTPSSGNVFADLGVPEAKLALSKANLASSLCDIVRRKKLSQTKAATLLGVTQPEVSDLTIGKLEGFTVDRLMTLLYRLGQEVDISVRAKKETAGD